METTRTHASHATAFDGFAAFVATGAAADEVVAVAVAVAAAETEAAAVAVAVAAAAVVVVVVAQRFDLKAFLILLTSPRPRSESSRPFSRPAEVVR